jgi:hypothetical protein
MDPITPQKLLKSLDLVVYIEYGRPLPPSRLCISGNKHENKRFPFNILGAPKFEELSGEMSTHVRKLREQ